MTRAADAPRRLNVPVTAGAVLLLIIAAALLAPAIAPYDPARQLDIVTLKNAAPSSGHLLGTDAYARDTLSRLLFGARLSLGIAAVATLTAVVAGALWGMIAAWAPVAARGVMLGAMDVYRSLPRILVMLAAFVVGGALSPLVLAVLVGLSLWPVAAAVAYAETARIRSAAFVQAAEALGTTSPRIVARHLLPHLAGPLSAVGTLLFADVIALEAGLSFIGLGIRPPHASWGGMIQDALPFLHSAWWVALAPTGALILTIVSITSIANRIDIARNVSGHR